MSTGILLLTICALISFMFVNFTRALAPRVSMQKTPTARILRPTVAVSLFNHRSCCSNISGREVSGYVDVHCHLTNARFKHDVQEVVHHCAMHGLDYVVVNGVRPDDNRKVMELCKPHKHLLPAIGIYPLDACCNVITPTVWTFDFDPPQKFDVDEEIEFIDSMAASNKIAAIGECGLDAHYLKDQSCMLEQERVLRKLMQVALKHDLPIILHARKAERRVYELLLEENVKKADFHCFTGKAALGKEIAASGYYFSIPSAISKEGSSFRRLVKQLPLDRILTETDSPYMGPVSGERNDPTTVSQTIPIVARIKGSTEMKVRDIVRDNFRTLFGI